MMGWLKRTRDFLLHRDAMARWPSWIYVLRSLHLATAGIGTIVLALVISLYFPRSLSTDWLEVALSVPAGVYVYAATVLCAALLDRRYTKTANTVFYYALFAPVISLLFTAIALVSLVTASYVIDSTAPARIATMSIPERNITVELELYSASPLGKAEYNRRLTVRNDTESASFDLYIDWGGADRVALYFDGQRCLIAVGVVDTIGVDLYGLTSPGVCQRYRTPKGPQHGRLSGHLYALQHLSGWRASTSFRLRAPCAAFGMH